MLITLKTLQQQTFKIEIDTTATVKQLKEKIETEKGSDYGASWQKLIYAGKILNDENLISDYELDEKKFVVVMVAKPKTVSTASESSSSAASSVSAATSATSSSTPTIPASSNVESIPVIPLDTNRSDKTQLQTETAPQTEIASSTTTATTTTASSGVSAAESTIVLGEDYQRMVQHIVEMGYNKPEVERALRASFNNPDRAVEYLINGLPSDTTEAQSQDTQESNIAGSNTNPIAASVGSVGSETPQAGEQEANPLEFLRTQPQFQQMRHVIQQNPQLLNAVMQQIGQSNPQLLQLITQNQEAFVRMLNEPNPNTGTTAGSGGGGGGGLTGSGVGSSGAANLESLIGSAQVTQQDKEAIERLKALGFPEYLVVQAYFACDKNENLAANFLLSQGFDD
jgi:UV excision repair protein RAD23